LEIIMERILELPLEQVIATVQVRKEFSGESLHGLMGTLRTVGQLSPIRVRKEGDLYVIIQGERRYRATKMAGFKTIAAIVEEQDLAPAAILHRQLVENCQRDNLTPMETAIAVAELMQETGWTATEVASNLGLSNATVSRLLALVRLPESIQAQVRSGAIPASAAYELGKIEDAAQQAALAEQIAAGQLSRDGVSRAAKRSKTPRNETAGKPSARIKAELSGGRSVTLAGGDGPESLESLIEWLDELLSKARRARPKGLALGTFLSILKDEARA
jgi:ParB family chromosome partitioning protein